MTAMEFFTKWGVYPPRNFGLLEPETPREKAGAVLTGEWGLIPVFAWTTDKEIHTAATRLRKQLAKRHQDGSGLGRGELAAWLRVSGFSGQEIARHLYGRNGRWKLSEREEAVLDADSAFKEEARRKQRPVDQVKKAIGRYRTAERQRKAKIRAPRNIDPLSFAVTMLLRARYLTLDATQAVQWLELLRAAALGQPTQGQKTA